MGRNGADPIPFDPESPPSALQPSPSGIGKAAGDRPGEGLRVGIVRAVHHHAVVDAAGQNRVRGGDACCVEDFNVDAAGAAYVDAIGRLLKGLFRPAGEEVAAGEECRVPIRHGHKIGVGPHRLFLQADECQGE